MRIAIAGIYLASFAIAILLWLPLYTRMASGAGDLGKQVAAIYATPLGVIFGSMFVRKDSGHAVGSAIGVLAIILVTAWNVVIVAAVWFLPRHFEYTTQVTDALNTLTTSVNFLTATLLAFLFTTSAKSNAKPEDDGPIR